MLAIVLNTLKNMTPEIVESLLGFLTELEKKAKESSNPWDDHLFEFLRMLFKEGGDKNV